MKYLKQYLKKYLKKMEIAILIHETFLQDYLKVIYLFII